MRLDIPPSDPLGFRLPPQSLEAEQGTLGSALMSRSAALLVVDRLEEWDFYHAANQRVFGAIVALVSRGEPVDLLTLMEELRRQGQLEQMGGAVYLAGLSQAVPTAAHVENYAAVVKTKSDLRALIDFCGETLASCYEPEADPEQVRQGLTLALLQQQGRAVAEAVNFADVLRLERERIARREAEPMLEFGIRSLDWLTGGLGRGEVGIIAAQPGGGKSALALMQMVHGAMTWGPMLYVSLEMSAQMVGRRQYAASTPYSYVELQKCARLLSTGEWSPFTERDLQHVEAAETKLQEAARLMWIDESSYTLSRLVHRVHRYRLQRGIEAVIIDYGQLVEDDTAGREVRKAEEVMRVVRAVKNQIATALQIPVWLLAQVNRDAEKTAKDGQAPRLLQMSDLAWSRELEAAAGRIVFLNPQGNSTDHRRRVLCDVAKNRNNQKGQIPLILDGPRFVFTEVDDRHAEYTAPPERRDLWEVDDE